MIDDGMVGGCAHLAPQGVERRVGVVDGQELGVLLE